MGWPQGGRGWTSVNRGGQEIRRIYSPLCSGLEPANSSEMRHRTCLHYGTDAVLFREDANCYPFADGPMAYFRTTRPHPELPQERFERCPRTCLSRITVSW